MIKVVNYILENDSTVQSLVGDNSRDDKHKVYPVVAPQSETAPYIVTRIVAGNKLGKGCGMGYQVLVSVVVNDYDTLDTLTAAVTTALEGQARGTILGVDFGSLTYNTESDDYDKEHNLYIKQTVFDGMIG
jgi:Protein of unknown function (DUF3168)